MEQKEVLKENVEEIKIISLTDIKEIRRLIKNEYLNIQIIQNTFDEETKVQREKFDDSRKPVLERLEKLNKQYTEMFNKACESATFSDDPFLKSVKVKGDSYKEVGSGLKIIRHIIEKRTLNQEAFKKKYPKQFKEIAKVELGKADAKVGKDNVTALCTIKREFEFEFYDPNEQKKESK